MLVACGAPSPPPPIANVAPKSTEPARTDTDDLLAMMLNEYIADPKSMPDAGLLTDSGPIDLVIDVEHGAPVRFERLPQGKRRFVIKTVAEIQHEADATKTRIGYLHLAISFDAKGAMVTRGGDIAFPADPKVIKMCCCSSSRHYDKTPAGWRPARTMMESCG